MGKAIFLAESKEAKTAIVIKEIAVVNLNVEEKLLRIFFKNSSRELDIEYESEEKLTEAYEIIKANL